MIHCMRLLFDASVKELEDWDFNFQDVERTSDKAVRERDKLGSALWNAINRFF